MLWHQMYNGKGEKDMSVGGQIIEPDSTKMYVYRVQSVLRCYVTSMQNVAK